MREIRDDELDMTLRELLTKDEEIKEITADELERQIEAAFEKPDVVAAVIFPLQRKRRRFPIPPRNTIRKG